jgi:glycosyltransferase involved in cell wall biosynthesis
VTDCNAEGLRGRRIAFVTGSLGPGGTERQLFYWLRVLVAHGGLPLVVDAGEGNHWNARIEGLGVPIVRVGASRPRPLRLARIVGELRRHDPHLIHSTHLFMNLYAAAAARCIGSRDIGSLRSTLEPKRERLGGMVTAASLRTPRILAVNSMSTFESAAAEGVSRSRIFLVRNAVDLEEFTPSHQASPSEPFRLLCVSRLVAEKRVDRFIDVLARVRAGAHRAVTGVVLGAGADKGLRPRLEQHARQRALPKGALEFRDPVAFPTSQYQEAQVYVHTATHESLPNTVLEAMACGLPVVATGAGDTRSLVEDGITGRVIEPYDATRMAEAVLQLVEHPEAARIMGRRGRAAVEAAHGLGVVSGDLATLYARAITT